MLASGGLLALEDDVGFGVTARATHQQPTVELCSIRVGGGDLGFDGQLLEQCLEVAKLIRRVRQVS